MTLCNCGCGQEVWVDFNTGEDGKTDVVLYVRAGENVNDLIEQLTFQLKWDRRFERRVSMTDAERLRFVASLLRPEERATMQAALRFYLKRGQDNPGMRDNEIHDLATAGDDVISLDETGVMNLFKAFK